MKTQSVGRCGTLLAALALLTSACTARSAPRTDHLKVRVGDVTRTCVVRVPAAYDGVRTLPLVIAIHGAGGSGAGMSWTFNALADREGFIAAYPDGITGDNRGGTAVYGLPIAGGHGAQVDDVDDVGFIHALIDQLHVTYKTDPGAWPCRGVRRPTSTAWSRGPSDSTLARPRRQFQTGLCPAHDRCVA